ncbi:MAG: HlyD family efflux transporter periplasmic adaptor subunit [Burkholderiales bacterium]|nr:HlyD family efflux transporter periplasmic adaptor subunit [Burkholderiales bacterium]
MSDLALPPLEASPRQATDFRAGDGTAALVLGLQATLLSHARLDQAATAFAAELAEALACERVCLGLSERDTIRLLALSCASGTEVRGAAAAAVEAAMNEALDQRTTIIHPQAAAGAPAISVAHQRLGASGAAAVLTIPLISAGRIIGALTLERAAPAFAPREIALCEDAACFAAPLFELKRAATRPWWKRLAHGLRDLGAALIAPGHAGAKLAAAGALAAVLAAGAVPIDYRVSAPARLEGSVQRVISAPADGFLQRANVRAGDTVHAGQVLAALAGEDLQLEQRRRQSEVRQHENAYRGAMARADRAQMVIHQAKAAEAQAMLDLIEGQLERAQIQAPFDGVVIKGDLTQNLGAPVQRGEVLLTISPAGGFRLIIEVDEADIGAVTPGQTGRLVLATAPDRSFDLRVVRVIPSATTAEGRNFFEVESALDTQGQALRPGLRGVAKLDAGQRSLLWILTHRAQDWLRLALWSLTP